MEGAGAGRGFPRLDLVVRPQAFARSADDLPMRLRVVLEWLGVMEPDRSRREPVAVPAWAPYVVSLVIAAGGTLSAFGAWLLLRALVS